MDKIKREPIQTTNEPVTIEYVPAQLSLVDFIPKHRYQFSEGSVLPEADDMYNNLLQFLDVNQEIILSQETSDQDEFAKGFKQAIALSRLWIDSMYLVRGDGNGNDN